MSCFISCVRVVRARAKKLARTTGQRNRPAKPFCHKSETGAYAISLVKAKIQLTIEHSNAEWVDPASIPYGVVFVGVTLQSYLRLDNKSFMQPKLERSGTIPLVTFEMHMREGARHSSTRGAKKKREWAARVGCGFWVLYSALGRHPQPVPRSGV